MDPQSFELLPRTRLLWTEPGWNDHTPADLRIDSFQADRSPDGKYRTMNLEGLFYSRTRTVYETGEQGPLLSRWPFPDVVGRGEQYDTRFNLGLSQQERLDLVEYLKSL